MRATIIFLVFTIFINSGYKNQIIPDGLPECVQKRINEIKSQPVSSPPGKVFRYFYNLRTVYYIPSKCCDIPSSLLDEDCQVICYPSGGFTGQGDGKCLDFLATRSEEKLIWQDPR